VLLRCDSPQQRHKTHIATCSKLILNSERPKVRSVLCCLVGSVQTELKKGQTPIIAATFVEVVRWSKLEEIEG
jgi:hypothetical protein